MTALAQEFQAGSYSVTLGGGPNSITGTVLGVTTNGIELTVTNNINYFGTDYSGQTEYEGIVAGSSGAISFELASTVNLHGVLSTGGIHGLNNSFVAAVGDLASAKSFTLLLTKLTGNNNYTSISTLNCTIDGDVPMNLENALETIPITFRLLPDSDGKLLSITKT